MKVWKHNDSWHEDGWNGSRYLDTENNVVGVNITSFSKFAPLGRPTIEVIDDYIQDLPENAFKNNADKRKNGRSKRYM